MVESSDQDKGKNVQIQEKLNSDPNSTSTSANAPEKTILTTVNSRNQQADFADESVTKKAKSNIVKN